MVVSKSAALKIGFADSVGAPELQAEMNSAMASTGRVAFKNFCIVVWLRFFKVGKCNREI
jgi:hypothetical protein